MLWRLVRLLVKNRASGASASLNLVQEKEESASRREVVAHYVSHGMKPPPARQAWEVSLWLDNSVPCQVYRGHTLAEALAGALKRK